jgi:sRNA-binding protein
LCNRYPRVFNLQIPHPLKINIVEDLYTQLKDEYSNEEIGKAIGYYTYNVRYHRALLAHEHRYDLEGKVNGKVTPEHKERAKTQLSKLKNSSKSKDRMSFSKNKEVLMKESSDD